MNGEKENKKFNKSLDFQEQPVAVEAGMKSGWNQVNNELIVPQETPCTFIFAFGIHVSSSLITSLA